MFDVETLKFDLHGLIPAIVQDYDNGEVLMMAFMNRISLEKTLETGLCHYWSRSRGKLWLKGETSGNTQTVREVYYDCDADCILVKVDQKTAACHTGNRSCFFTKIEADGISEVGRKVFEATDVYSGSDVLDKIFTVVKDRIKTKPDATGDACDSYVAGLVSGGRDRVLKKVGEESAEFIIAAKNADKTEVVREAADVFFHMLVALAESGVEATDVYAELKSRRK